MENTHDHCSNHKHGTDGHICGPSVGSGLARNLDEMLYERGLWGAVIDGKLAKVKEELNKQKWDINARDKSGYTVLHFAARNGNAEICRELLMNGADPNAKTTGLEATPLQRAAYMGHVSVIQTLYEFKADLNLQDSDGWTALHKAASQGKIAAVKLLLKLGALDNICDTKGRTACQVGTSETQPLFDKLL